MQLRIALLPGDGIGPEVIDAAALVLHAVGRRFNHQFEMRAWPMGGAALALGSPPLPPDTLDACAACDAVLLGAVGDARFDAAPRAQRPEAGLLALRKALGVYANLRPARLWAGLEALSPLRAEIVSGFDAVIVRELTGGLYFGEPRAVDMIAGTAVNTLGYTRTEIERVARVAFELAGARRRHVTSVDKANVLETSQLWRSAVCDMATEYPAIRLEHMYVDACAFELVRRPSRFDVILTDNLFGDILSDQAGGVAGSLGLLPSASIGAGTGLFEPVHGTAPDLAGHDSANPVGAILSAALLLRHAGGGEREAESIESAVAHALREGTRTADLPQSPGRQPVRCSEFGREIAARVREERSVGRT